jgi:hypothetical protein
MSDPPTITGRRSIPRALAETSASTFDKVLQSPRTISQVPRKLPRKRQDVISTTSARNVAPITGHDVPDQRYPNPAPKPTPTLNCAELSTACRLRTRLMLSTASPIQLRETCDLPAAHPRRLTAVVSTLKIGISREFPSKFVSRGLRDSSDHVAPERETGSLG